MADKSKFFDYEPISRSNISPQRLSVTGDAFKKRHPSAQQSLGMPLNNEGSSKDGLAVPQKDEAQMSEFSKGLLRRAHSLSFVGLFLFTFVLYVRPYELSSSLAWTKGIAFWIAIVTIAIYLPTQLGVEGTFTIRPREVNLVLLLFLLALLSVPLGADPQNSWDAVTDYVKVVLMFIVFVNVVRTEWRLRILLLTVLLVSCLLSFSVVNDYRLGILASNGERVKGIIGGMFDNPNDLALHLVTMIPIAMALVFGSRSYLKKVFYGAAAVMMTAGVVVTFSRGGFLGLACMACVFGWRIARQNKGFVILVPLVLGLFILLAPGGYGTRLSTTSDGSAEARTDDLKRSIFIAARHPLLGVGLNNYILYSNKEHASHNAYTEVASELGLTALVVYVLFLITPIKALRKLMRETPSKGPKSRFHYLAIGLEASLIGYMVSSFFASVAFLWYVYYLIGYSVCLRRLYMASELRDNGGTSSATLPTVRGESPLATVAES